MNGMHFMNQLLIVKCSPKDKSRIASEMKAMIAENEPEVEFSEYKKEEKKITRWQAISESAAKQSKRMYVPEVSHVMSFKEALAYANNLDVILLPYERAKGMQETKAIINSIKPGQSIGIFIGPEGGFDEKEVEQSMDEGAKAITLGKRILRTETAGLTVLSVLMFALEE